MNGKIKTKQNIEIKTNTFSQQSEYDVRLFNLITNVHCRISLWFIIRLLISNLWYDFLETNKYLNISWNIFFFELHYIIITIPFIAVLNGRCFLLHCVSAIHMCKISMCLSFSCSGSFKLIQLEKKYDMIWIRNRLFKVSFAYIYVVKLQRCLIIHRIVIASRLFSHFFKCCPSDSISWWFK